MHDRIDAVERRKSQASRDERRARGVSAGSALVGSGYAGRRYRSISVAYYMSKYTIVDGAVVQYAPLGMGAGAFGSTLGFMSGGTDRG